MKYLSLAAALVLTACVQTGHADETAFSADFSKMDWTLASVDGQPAGYTATMNLGEPGRITGQAPCNRYFADLMQDGGSFVLGPIASTQMACLQIEGEAEFFEAMQSIKTVEKSAGMMTLHGGGHVMVFMQPVN